MTRAWEDAEAMFAEMDAERAARPVWRKAYDEVSRRVYGAYKTVSCTVPREMTWAWQRVFRGWDDRSLWSYDRWLCKTMAEQLEKFARTSHTFPGDGPYEDAAVWEADLVAHAAVLLRYVDFAENGLVGLAPGEYGPAWATVHAELRATFAWLGEWLPAIWD